MNTVDLFYKSFLHFKNLSCSNYLQVIKGAIKGWREQWADREIAPISSLATSSMSPRASLVASNN